MRDEILAPDFSTPETNETLNVAHWEQEKEKLALALTERLLRGRDRLAFSELKQAPVFREPGVAQTGEIVVALLRQQARQIIRQEKPLVLQSKRRFELEDNDMRGQLRRLRDLLAERLVFEKEEVQAAVAFAVRLQFDLLTKPGAALEGLIYSHSPQRRKADVGVILEGLEENHPLVAALKNLVTAFAGETLTQEEFAALRQRAESEVYGAPPISALLADLRAYQNFCASLGPASAPRLDRQTVWHLLDERGWRELAEKAQSELAQQQWWTVTEIAPVLERALALPHPPAPEPLPMPLTEAALSRAVQDAAQQIENLLAALPQIDVAPPLVEAPTSLHLIDASAPALSANGKDEDEATTAPAPEVSVPPEIPPPVEIEFEEVDLHAILQVEEATIPPPRIAAGAVEEEPLIITRAGLEAQPPGPYPSMTRLIDGKSRQAFIKKVFHRDLDAYLGFIEALEAAQTWKEAKALLDGTFKQRKVNPFSKEAVHMSDLVFSRYFTRSAK